MLRTKTFRIGLIAATLLLMVSLACSLSTTVNCNTPALITAINNANSNPSPSTLSLAAGCTYTLTAVDNTATSSFSHVTLLRAHFKRFLELVEHAAVNGRHVTLPQPDTG